MLLLIRGHGIFPGMLRKKFTFHYASTYTIFWQNTPGRLTTFTFHYASTYTDVYSVAIHCIADLHSTMLLLILRGRVQLNREFTIFTFHYASTYTRFRT